MTSERTKRRRVKEELESVFDIDVNDFNLQNINQHTLKAVSNSENVICNKPKKEYYYSPKLTTANDLTDDNCFNSELLFSKVIVILHSQLYNNFLFLISLLTHF